jgi:hypothetical protein
MWRHTLSLLILLLATRLFPWKFGTQVQSIPIRVFPYPLGTDHAQKTQFYCCVEQTTQKASNVITISPVYWRSDCCLATTYKHSSYFLRDFKREGVYRDVAWQWVDMSQLCYCLQSSLFSFSAHFVIFLMCRDANKKEYKSLFSSLASCSIISWYRRPYEMLVSIHNNNCVIFWESLMFIVLDWTHFK